MYVRVGVKVTLPVVNYRTRDKNLNKRNLHMEVIHDRSANHLSKPTLSWRTEGFLSQDERKACNESRNESRIRWTLGATEIIGKVWNEDVTLTSFTLLVNGLWQLQHQDIRVQRIMVVRTCQPPYVGIILTAPNKPSVAGTPTLHFLPRTAAIPEHPRVREARLV